MRTRRPRKAATPCGAAQYTRRGRQAPLAGPDFPLFTGLARASCRRLRYRGQTLLTARIVAHATQRGLVRRAPGRRRSTSTARPPRRCHSFLRVWLSVQRPSSHGNSRRPGL